MQHVVGARGSNSTKEKYDNNNNTNNGRTNEIQTRTINNASNIKQ
jgi:hypothetical protein